MKEIELHKKKNPVLLILLICIYTILLIPQIQKRFIADEILFVQAAIGILKTGLPVYYNATNEMQFALWHPPLYLYMLGASFKVFGTNEWNARILSVFFTMATLFIIYKFAEAISNNRSVTLLSCFIFLLSPLIVQGSLIIDLDNGILMFLFIFFIYIYCIINKTRSINLFFLGILFGMVLWAKLTTPPLIILGIIVFNLLNKNFKKGITESLIIGSIGAGVFSATWFIYTRQFDLPFLMPFAHSSGYLNIGDGFHFLLTHLWGFKNILFWANPFFILFMFIVSIKRVNRYFINQQLEISDLLLIIGLLIFFQYLFVGSYQTQDFPRYFLPMMPLFSILIADFLSGPIHGFEDKPLAGLILIITSIYVLFVVGDPMLIDRIIFETGSIYDIVMTTAQTFLLYLSPFVVSYILFKIARTKNAAIIALFISLIALNIGINISHSHAEYYTGYFHGEKGMDKVIKYCGSYVGKDNAIIARHDVAYYLSTKEYYYLPNNYEEFTKLVEDKNIIHIILNKEGYFTTSQHAQVLDNMDRNFKMKAEYGDFKIFQRR